MLLCEGGAECEDRVESDDADAGDAELSRSVAVLSPHQEARSLSRQGPCLQRLTRMVSYVFPN